MSVKPHSLAVSKPDHPWQALRVNKHIGLTLRMPRSWYRHFEAGLYPMDASEERGEEGRGAGQGENRSDEAEITPPAKATHCSRRKSRLD